MGAPSATEHRQEGFKVVLPSVVRVAPDGEQKETVIARRQEKEEEAEESGPRARQRLRRVGEEGEERAPAAAGSAPRVQPR